MQQITAEIVLTIPADKVLIAKEEYDRLKELEVYGQTGDMSWFSAQVGMSDKKAKDVILYPFRKEMEQFVYYPKKTGEPWRFHKTRTLDWLEKNWERYEKSGAKCY